MASPTSENTYRAELYLRGDTFGTYDAQQQILDRVTDLDEQGALEMAGLDEWQAIQTVEYEHRDGALATYEEFQDWARHNDARLEPTFNQRMQTGIDRTEVTRVVVFPVIAMALYETDRLAAVFPCTTSDDHFRVQDCLSAFESADVSRFLEQFAPRGVDRTAPRLDAALG